MKRVYSSEEQDRAGSAAGRSSVGVAINAGKTFGDGCIRHQSKRADRTLRRSLAPPPAAAGGLSPPSSSMVGLSVNDDSGGDDGEEWSCFGMGRKTALSPASTPDVVIGRRTIPESHVNLTQTPCTKIGCFGTSSVARLSGASAELVTLKMIDASALDSARLSSLCSYLQTLASQGSHDFLCKIVGCVKKLGCCPPPLLLEHCSRGSIEDIFTTGFPPPPPIIAARVALGTALCLYSLHSTLGFPHGSLRGGNVLIRADWSPCLCDVGLANFLPENLFRWAAPHSSWLAPEIVQLGAGGQRAQAVPGAALSFAADIFALGGVLCEIFYCVKPWEHPNGAVSHTFAAAEGADFMDVQCAAPSVPPSLPYPRIAHVMERCWATSPINRPTMQEIVACLQSLCATLGGDTALQTALQRQERGTAMSEPPSITCSSSSLVSEDEEAGGRLLMYASPS